MGRRAALAAALLALALLAGCGGGGGDRDAPPPRRAATTPAVDPAVQARLMRVGKRAYHEQCSICHTLLGRRRPRDPKPDAYGSGFDEIVVPERYIVERARDGFGGMGSYGGALTPYELRAVARYVVTVGGREVEAAEPPPAARVAAGERVFAERCARCHAIAGRAASDPPGWAPTDFGVVRPTARFVEDVLTAKRYEFMATFMVRLRGKLSREQIRAVATYVAATAGGEDDARP